MTLAKAISLKKINSTFLFAIDMRMETTKSFRFDNLTLTLKFEENKNVRFEYIR